MDWLTNLNMKKLYKATYHTVYYIDLDKDTIQNEVLELINKDVVTISEGYSAEITKAEQLPDGWTVNDFPTFGDYRDMELTIGDILDGKDTSDLEKELNDLKNKIKELEKELKKRK